MDGGCTVYDSQSACCIICTEPTSGDCGVMNRNGIIIPSWWRAFFCRTVRRRRRRRRRCDGASSAQLIV